MFGKWPGVRRFSLAICPRACSLSHVMLSVQEYGRLPSVNRGTSLRGTTAGRDREGLGKKNQSLNVSYAIDKLYQRHGQKGSANIGARCAGHAVEREESIANAAPADTVIGMESHTPQKLYAFVDESG